MDKTILVIAIISLIAVLVEFRIRNLRLANNLNLFDGMFFGGCIFVVVPIILTFFIGPISIPDFDINYSYNWSKDIETTLYALISVLCFGVVSLSKQGTRTVFLSKRIPQYCKNYLLLSFILYSVSEIIFFIASGKSEGNAHWYNTNAATFQKNSLYVLLAQFHNVGRVIIPAIFIYLEIKSPFKQIFRLHFAFSAILILIELGLSGNRIVMMFILVSFLLPFILQKRVKSIGYLILFAIPLVAIAQIWPQFRGLIWTEKISFERIGQVLTTSVETASQSNFTGNNNPLLVATEGSNLVVLNYTLHKYQRTSDFLFGETIIVKSLGTFIPKSVWKNKPEGVGSRIGEEISDYNGLVLNTTIIGEAWANFGVLGIPIILMLLYLIDLPFSQLQFRTFFSTIMFMAGIASWRFDFSFLVVSIIIITLIHLLLQIGFIRSGIEQFSKVLFSRR